MNADEEFVQPEVVSIGTCRVLRIRRIGRVFFIEQNQQERVIDDKGERLVDNWIGIAVSKGEKARAEAHDFLDNANAQFIQESLKLGAA